METAENIASGKRASEQLADLFYTAVGLAAVAKEKVDEFVEEVKANNPEAREKGEKIVNEIVENAKTTAEKFTDEVKNKYSDWMYAANGFVKEQKDKMQGSKDEDEDEDEDVWADKDSAQEKMAFDDDDDMDDDDDLDYVGDDADKADLENDEFEDEEGGHEKRDTYPKQHEANSDTNVPPANTETSGSKSDGATGENPTRINPAL